MTKLLYDGKTVPTFLV